ncbi:hypothetical protein C1637_09840 [Chryseobacterium lactis]|uniref:Uncharacterized protein n=1 Tax=Chryseobacterium lactis TaxID=1241981 RepID=A0A3G6RHA0_CHRLC|nr:hypothetical protein [Chryseobacterium lactis]AZA82188.1 hypothetical protein EG342_09860 [Chryseobacterium lactis]AZB02569.1 hypothetical protein EG341_00715 [Chryseobacterium lactis]PNW14136.1 hypothetical protein C1637_09840 [Chryseobacterium lactis]
MTKEEQLRIYSAYLPYKLQVEFKRNIYPASVEIQTLDLKNLSSVIYQGKSNSFKMKPILWDLSYLTKDEFNFIWENETDSESLEQAIALDAESFLTCKFSYDFWQELFKNHFNVFGLPECEYINKATLTQKQ